MYGKSAEELEQIAQRIYGEVSGCMYVPCELNSKGLPYLEVGDLLWINREEIFTYLMKRTLTGVYALKDSISSTGEQIRSVENNVNTEIIQLKGRTVVIEKNVEEVSVRVTDLSDDTEAMFEIMSDEISMKVSEGDVTNQLNSELSITGNVIALRTGNFTVESENLTFDSNGNATFSGRVTSASFEGGIIEVGAFYADDEDVQLGDWCVSADGSNVLRTWDGSVVFQSATGTGPLGDYPALQISSNRGTTTVSDHHIETPGVITDVINGDCTLANRDGSDNWWAGYTLFEALDWLYDAIKELEGV